jgi:osmotically-inducible protein OsmY
VTDAYTTDLNIEVEVEDGVVYLHGTVGSLDDVEQAEQIAGSVPGVVEVDEDLEIV